MLRFWNRKMIQSSALRLRRFKILTKTVLQFNFQNWRFFFHSKTEGNPNWKSSVYLFRADATIFSMFFLVHKKLKKPPSKVAQKFSKLFSPIVSKTAQTEESCFKMWLIDQLYVELGNRLAFLDLIAKLHPLFASLLPRL